MASWFSVSRMNLAVNGPEYDRWEAAMDDELQSLSDNGAWKLTGCARCNHII